MADHVIDITSYALYMIVLRNDILPSDITEPSDGCTETGSNSTTAEYSAELPAGRKSSAFIIQLDSYVDRLRQSPSHVSVCARVCACVRACVCAACNPVYALFGCIDLHSRCLVCRCVHASVSTCLRACSCACLSAPFINPLT